VLEGAPAARSAYPEKLAVYARIFAHDERSVKRWIKRGREAIGGPDLPPLQDPPKMLAWWAKHFDRRCPPEIVAAAREVQALSPAVVAPPVVDNTPSPLTPPADPPASAALGGYGDMLDRVRRAEAAAGREFERLSAESGDARDEGKIAAALRSWKGLADQLRELERDARKIQEASGEILPTAEVRRVLADLHGPIVNGMRSILRRIYQQVQNAGSMSEADRIYQREVDRVCGGLQDSQFLAFE